MTKTFNTEYTQWYEVHGTVDLRKDPTVQKTVKVGITRGMSDNGQPGWSEHGATHFPTKEEGLELTKYLSLHWNHINLRDIRVIKKQRIMIIDETEEIVG